MGTPLYMSPEQIEGRELDSRSDIYSLGVTAYHMLAGEPPFAGDSPLSVAVQHLNQPAPPLVGRRPDVPARLAEVIERMLAKKPAERFSDPAALSSELQAVAVEGAEQGWAAVPDSLSLSQLIHAANERVEATTRLDQLMKSSGANRPQRLAGASLIAAVVGCFLLGTALAVLTRPDSLLTGAQGGPPAQDSVWAQLYHAKMVDTELAWKAVGQNFPDVGRYGFHHNLAREGLAYYYLQKVQNYEKALEPLEQLANLSEREQRFRAFGIAGLVVAYANLGADDPAYDDLAYNENQRLDPAARALLQEQAPRMDRLLNGALDELTNRALSR
jgi:serine/threonine-protein kinase